MVAPRRPFVRIAEGRGKEVLAKDKKKSRLKRRLAGKIAGPTSAAARRHTLYR
jgi:hypothetical protein